MTELWTATTWTHGEKESVLKRITTIESQLLEICKLIDTLTDKLIAAGVLKEVDKNE